MQSTNTSSSLENRLLTVLLIGTLASLITTVTAGIYAQSKMLTTLSPSWHALVIFIAATCGAMSLLVRTASTNKRERLALTITGACAGLITITVSIHHIL